MTVSIDLAVIRPVRPLIAVYGVILGCALVAGCATAPPASSDDPGRLLKLANQVKRQGDPAMAASMYAHAAKLSGDAPSIYVKMGNAWLAAGRPEAAAEAYRDALRRRQDYSPALLGIGRARLQMGQLSYAAQALGQAAPAVKSVEGWSQLGVTRALLGESVAAEAAFRQAARLSKGVDIRSNLALANALANHHDEAVRRLRTVCNSPLAEPRHFRNLLLVLVLADKDQQARELRMPGVTAAQHAALYRSAVHIRRLPFTGQRARAMGFTAAAQKS